MKAGAFKEAPLLLCPLSALSRGGGRRIRRSRLALTTKKVENQAELEKREGEWRRREKERGKENKGKS